MSRRSMIPEGLRTPISSSLGLEDDALVQAGDRVLKERFGTAGMLRYLRLVAGSNERFEDLRKEWVGCGMDEALRRMGFPCVR